MKKFFYAIVIIYELIVFPSNVADNIICNDGTISPSCGDCHRGCCSNHGGCSNNSNGSSSTSGGTTNSNSSNNN